MHNRASSSVHTNTPTPPAWARARYLSTGTPYVWYTNDIRMFQGNQRHHAPTSVQAGAAAGEPSSGAVNRQASWYGWLPGFMRGAARRDINPPVFTRPLQQPLVTRLFGRSTKAAAASATRAAAVVNTSSTQHHNEGPTHLIVLVNGLFGSSSNWDVVCEQLKQHVDPKQTLLHPSAANSRFETYEGINRCGSRLASEVREVVSHHQSLQRISIIAHSMGGLMARYAIGMLYNTNNKSVCGLEPMHFVTLATPHCGCDAEGVAQVPFIGWTGDLPLLGPHLLKVLQDISAATAALIFRDTGKQFFMLDGSSSTNEQQQAQEQQGQLPSSSSSSSSSTAALPVLLQMTQDCPDRGLFFYSALSAFKTRTCYANTDGDHLVGYANSSIRSLHELPPLPAAAMTAKGVVMEDPVTSAFFPEQWQQLQQSWQQSGGSSAEIPAAAAAAAGVTLQQPYQPSRHWPPADAEAATRAKRSPGTAAADNSSSSTGWHELEPAQSGSSGSGSSSRKRKSFADVSKQEVQGDISTVAALELAAAGAAAAATEAVADLLSPYGQQQQQQLSAIPVDSSSRPERSLSFRANTSVNTNPLRRSLSSSSNSSAGSEASAAAAAAAEQDLASGLSGAGTTAAGNRQSAVESVAADAAALAASNASRAEMVAHMLHRLQELPWRRVDVSFRGARFGFAHNNIQVTRRWWNFEGEQVPRHLAQQMEVMDAVLMHSTAAAGADVDHHDGDGSGERLITEAKEAGSQQDTEQPTAFVNSAQKING